MVGAHRSQKSTEGIRSDDSVSKSGHLSPAADGLLPHFGVNLIANMALLLGLLRNFGCYPPAWGEVSTYEENGEDASVSIGSDLRGGH